jgi:choline dehydrogenase
VVGKTASDFVITAKCTFFQTLPDPGLEDWISGNDPTNRGVYGTSGVAIAIVQESSIAENSVPDLLVSGAPADFTGYYPGYSDAAFRDAQYWAWIVLKDHSRNNAGTVKLRSADPRDTPIINFNSFDTGVTNDDADEKDLQAVYEAVEFSRKALADLSPLNGSFTEVWPGPNVTTEAQVKKFIKDEAWCHHASCTCPVGADDDPMAVLDSNFRVRGVQSLRVVDTSVFPRIPGFYIALPVYMTIEKDVIINGVV